jgi:hypothetical protein
MSTIVESLTKDIVARDLSAEGAALLNKWEKTGLLEGLDNERTKNGMARLLENQAKQLLKEASTMSAGDVEGFAAVAFPIVRRVFGGLIANELVSVQPMSLPSGLIFFLDFTFGTDRPGGSGQAVDGESLYGGGVVGKNITNGVDLSGQNAEKSFYALNNGYASPTGSSTLTLVTIGAGTVGQDTNISFSGLTNAQKGVIQDVYNLGSATNVSLDKLVRYDADLDGETVGAYVMAGIPAAYADLNLDDLITLNIPFVEGAANGSTAAIGSGSIVRRLTGAKTSIDSEGNRTAVGANNGLVIIVRDRTGATTGALNSSVTGANKPTTFAVRDDYDAGGALGSVVGDLLALEGAGDGASLIGDGNQTIPEIDIQVDSVAVTATTKKLKAKWSPELAQDLNAYHNLDAEVELTSILSEQVALEIDQEILNDLIQGATAGTKYWSRRPGKFVNRDTGAQVGATTSAPDFTGTVSEWYETLAETINDVSAQIHRKTLRGGANFVVCSPEVANLLEFTAGFRATVNHEELKGGSIGAVKTGALSKKFDVYVDPYFPRNVVLVGRRGNSFLESGFVYAPYVPLQVTPTIFGVEDFVPRKGVMTRYAKKMVRPDMYGLVICQDLIG